MAEDNALAGERKLVLVVTAACLQVVSTRYYCYHGSKELEWSCQRHNMLSALLHLW